MLPQKCGSLPSDSRKADLSYSQFRRSLKTFIFGQPDHGALWTFLTALCRNIPAYLLTKKSRCFVVLIDVPLSANFAKKGGAGLVIFVGSGTAFGGPTSRDAPTLVVLWPVGHWWLPLCSLVIRRWSHVLVEAPVRPSLVARLLMALILIAAASARERERECERERRSSSGLDACTTTTARLVAALKATTSNVAEIGPKRSFIMCHFSKWSEPPSGFSIEDDSQRNLPPRRWPRILR